MVEDPDTLTTVEMCPVVAVAPAVRVPVCRGFSWPRVLLSAGSLDREAEVGPVKRASEARVRVSNADAFGHRSVIEGLHPPNKANNDSRQRPNDRF